MPRKKQEKQIDPLWEAFIEIYPIDGTKKEKVAWLAELREKSPADCMALTPEVLKIGQFPAKYRQSSRIPFGYIQDPDHKWLLWPIPEHIRELEKAIEYVKKKGVDLRRAAEWLAARTGRSIGHTGLSKIIEQREATRRVAQERRRWVEQRKKLDKILREAR